MVDFVKEKKRRKEKKRKEMKQGINKGKGMREGRRRPERGLTGALCERPHGHARIHLTGASVR